MSMTRARPEPPAIPAGLYETDFHSWAIEQAGLIRAGALDAADLVNIAEEIESLGREQASKLRSAYRLAAMHLLKLMLQPEKASDSWRETIREQRSQIEDIIDDSPGLKPRRDELFAKAYATAGRQAEGDTGLPISAFPVDPPFTRQQVEDRTFWPKL